MTKKYLHNIDAIRGIAIFLVLTYHTLLILYPNYEARQYSENGILIINDLKSFFLNFNPIGQGRIGVELFLVISGFLIHYIYLQNSKEFNWKNFFSKRFWRIYPPYVIVLLYLFLHHAKISQTSIVNILSHLFLVHNLDDTTFFAINPSFWSIALECQLYMIYPAYLFIRKRLSLYQTTLIIFAIQILLSTIAFYWNITTLSFNTFVLKYWFVWAVGAFLAEKYCQNQQIFNKPLIWFIFFYITFFISKVFYFSSFFILIPATFSCLSLIEYFLYSSFINKNIANKLIFKFLSFTGLISYSIYLIHQPYLENLLSFFDPGSKYGSINTLLSVMLTYVIIFILSYSLYHLLEIKSIEYGKKVRGTSSADTQLVDVIPETVQKNI
jgi:peptidoglycan/LPS O-acetylase OafA/YrhL